MFDDLGVVDVFEWWDVFVPCEDVVDFVDLVGVEYCLDVCF